MQMTDSLLLYLSLVPSSVDVFVQLNYCLQTGKVATFKHWL